VLRAVLDANVYISAAIHPEGPPGRVIDRFLRESSFEIVLSPAIVEEALRAFAYPKVRKFLRDELEPELWLEDLALLAHLVSGKYPASGLCPDPDDDKYISAALEGRAGLIVTGDREFLAMKEHEGVRIVSPRTFLELLAAHPPRVNT
jgi:putative PIN family toxin of toxin-antitoxin system